MEAIELLLHRNSASKLVEPAPDADALAVMFQAAIRAPDHARLRPWRFLVLQGPARQLLGELLVEVAAAEGEKAELLRTKPLRAPMIIAVLVKLSEHPKVPEIEQYLSAACAAHNLLLAAEALGYAGIWRTGSATYSAVTRQGLGLAEDERIIGFVYLGSRENAAKALPEMAWQDYVREL